MPERYYRKMKGSKVIGVSRHPRPGEPEFEYSSKLETDPGIKLFLEPEKLFAGAKTNAYWMIDLAAESARAKHFTLGAGQALVYQRKEQEAREFAKGRYTGTQGAG